ncbi:DUF4362 domain-containing protein [Neobacillus vireti]|uniref:DUF4362 domain-containing protein n=1 Tax=Neobacillus vireti LMG 21834 TaxID=1131730 RepID=A0AB94IGD7_9BACI|nr:DUF4362 domain-containing protein [Neobacillus vireti]ETI66175.1 hypothetical protein BAVI_23954 [Neobacillus vireti LMG 21834]
MKRFLLAMMLLSIVISTIGCSSNGAYSSEEAIKRGDIVYQGEAANLERFEQFLLNLSNKKEDTIRVTGYTDEGDPIFKDLQFDGKDIQYTYDNSKDEYGGKDKGIVKDVCTEITKKENEQGEVEFFISGCSKGNDGFLIRVEKDKLKHN